MSNSLVRTQFSKVAGSYDRAHAALDIAEVRELVREAMLGKGSLALDVGCGTGAVAFELARGASKVWGIDVTDEMLIEARRKRRLLGFTNVFFRKGDGENIPFKREKFDVLACRYAFHHFPDPGKGFSEFSRVLKPGGQVLFNDVVVPDDKLVDSEINMIEWDVHPSHVKYYSPRHVVSLARQAGFRVLSKSLRRRRVLESKLKQGVMERMRLFNKASQKTRRYLNLKSLEEGMSYEKVSAIIVFGK